MFGSAISTTPAARAGQAGAGLAVVAAEIGRLADETSTRASRVAETTRALNLLLSVGAAE